MPASPPATGTVVKQIAASAMHTEWTVVFSETDHRRVICFAVRALDDTVVPLIYDEESRTIRDANEIGLFDLN